MLAAPGDLNETELAEALLGGWGIQVAVMSYLAVGWGSHHFDVTGGDGTRWFITVDELERKRSGDHEPLADGFARLSASLRSAVALRSAGRAFVVAPVPAAGGAPAARFGGHFAVAAYPYTTGESFGWGHWTPAARTGVLAMIAEHSIEPFGSFHHAWKAEELCGVRGASVVDSAATFPSGTGSCIPRRLARENGV